MYPYDTDDNDARNRLSDPRFSMAIIWAGGVLSVFFTSIMIWLAAGMVQIKADIAVLLARPEGVSREEYMRSESRRDSDDMRRDSAIERNAREIQAVAKSK